jgi:hypothetical protein
MNPILELIKPEPQRGLWHTPELEASRLTTFSGGSRVGQTAAMLRRYLLKSVRERLKNGPKVTALQPPVI